MIVEERNPLPESVGGLLDAGVRAYARRFLLYAGVAVAGFALEAAFAYFVPRDPGGLLAAGEIVVDALISAVVTLGVIADLRLSPRPANATVLNTALQRWGIVAVVGTIVSLVVAFTQSAVVGSPEDTAYGFLSLPIIVAWGSLNFATVIAAIDDKTRPELLIFSSLGRSFSLALARQNIGRLVLLSLVTVVPLLLQNLLVLQLKIRHVAGADFLGGVPIDVALVGPLQALCTVFYLDFIRRVAAARPR